MSKLKVYLAGPEVFLKNAIEVLERKKEICNQYGWNGLAPIDNEVSKDGDLEQVAASIYSGNVEMMEEADVIIANITPFRGPHMDPGTAFEIGYFAAQKKPVMLYTQADEKLLGRVAKWSGEVLESGHGLVDRNGHSIENFNLNENLMIDNAVDGLGVDADVVVSPVSLDKVFECCEGFEQACERMHRLLNVKKAFMSKR